MPGRRLCRAAGASLAKKAAGPPPTRGLSQLGEPLRGWASPYSLEVGASHQTRLGRAVKRGWGEPSNEVGASRQTRLGEPSNEVGRASTKGWASHSTFTASTPASKLAWRGAYSACSARLLRHLLSACSAHLLSACSARLVECQLGTVPARRCARSAHLLTSACSARARSAHLVTSARSALCQLGTVPARHV